MTINFPKQYISENTHSAKNSRDTSQNKNSRDISLYKLKYKTNYYSPIQRKKNKNS